MYLLLARGSRGLTGAEVTRKIAAGTGAVAQAGVAQLAEQRFCKPRVVGSSPTIGSTGVQWGDARVAKGAWL